MNLFAFPRLVTLEEFEMESWDCVWANVINIQIPGFHRIQPSRYWNSKLLNFLLKLNCDDEQVVIKCCLSRFNGSSRNQFKILKDPG